MTPIPKNAQAHTLHVLRLELHRIPIPALTTYLPTHQGRYQVQMISIFLDALYHF